MVLQLIVSGLAAGSVYALVALGLVLIFRTSRIVNFAQGELAMVSTFFALSLLKMKLNYYVALPLTLAFAGLLGIVTERLFLRPALKAPPLNVLIITLGVWTVLNNGAGWVWTRQSFGFPSPFPGEPLRLAEINIGFTHVGTITVSFLIMALLFAFLQFTKEGRAMRATAENRVAARLMGISVNRVYALTWAASSVIAAVGGLLLAPIISLDVNMMFPVLLKAFAGAVLGGFESLPGAVIGCLLLGILENLLGAMVSTTFQNSLAFVVIVVVLLVRPSGLFANVQSKKV